jgi:hypothetical protein
VPPLSPSGAAYSRPSARIGLGKRRLVRISLTAPLEANVYNDDNLNYGSIISVYTGPDDTITALTDDDIDELKDMFMDARIMPETWHAFLDDFVDDAASRQSYRVFTQPLPIADGRRCGRNV